MPASKGEAIFVGCAVQSAGRYYHLTALKESRMRFIRHETSGGGTGYINTAYIIKAIHTKDGSLHLYFHRPANLHSEEVVITDEMQIAEAIQILEGE